MDGGAEGPVCEDVGTLLAVAGEWGTPDETVRYAITVAGIITALALGIAAIYVCRGSSAPGVKRSRA